MNQREYYETKAKVFLKCKGKCAVCEKDIFNLEINDIKINLSPSQDAEIHHLDKNRNNNSLENLLLVCNKCHRHNFHKGGKEMWKG